MDEPSAPSVDLVVRLGRSLLALAVAVAALGSLVAPYVSGKVSEEGEPVVLGLVQWSNLDFEPISTGQWLWRIDVAATSWLALALVALAVIRFLRLTPRVVSVAGKVITAGHLICAVLVFPLSGRVADRAGEDWRFQWGWWVPIVAGVLSGLATWFDDELRDAGWAPLTMPRY